MTDEIAGMIGIGERHGKDGIEHSTFSARQLKLGP